MNTTKRRLYTATLALAAAAPSHAGLLIYDDQLANGFQDYSYSTHDLTNTNPVHGGSRSIRFDPGTYSGLQFVQPNVDYRFTDYQALHFWVHGGGVGGQSLHAGFSLDGYALVDMDITPYIVGGAVAANSWREVVLPFDALALTHGGFNGVSIQGFSNSTQAVLFVDDIQFESRTVALASPAINVSVDFSANRKPINPEIYGVNFGSTAQHADLRYPLRRWGGNSTTRYNWQFDVHSTAYDYFWQNIPDTPLDVAQLPNGSTADQFIEATRLYGGQALMTVNTLGLVPIDLRQKRWSFSQIKYGPQDLDECRFYFGNDPVPPGHFCQPDSGNGECANTINNTGFCVNGKIVGNDPADTSRAVAPSYTQSWVGHLIARFNNAANGGVRYYALDNEPMLWNSTHRDLHPAGPGYDEVRNKGFAVAVALKQTDPTAIVFGPDTWGWCDLFTSGLDAANNGPGGSCISGADRNAHGGLPFVRWYLQQVCAYQQANGVRPVDVLDVHWYPQGNGIASVNNGFFDELSDVAALRLRSLKELYDPVYVSESYVSDVVRLIPRLREWIASDCPGLKLGITEYKWGPDDGPSGALAQAVLLAIFGREGLDYAARWVAPADGSRAEQAFRMFLDYDGANSRLLGDSVQTSSANSADLLAFTIDRSGQAVYVLLFNLSSGPRSANVSFGETLNGNYSSYRFEAVGGYTAAAAGAINSAALNVSALPGRSATLLVLPARSGAGNAIFADGFE